jgi:hypothetical protein
VISAFVADAVAIAPKNQRTFGVSIRGSRSSSRADLAGAAACAG